MKSYKTNALTALLLSMLTAGAAWASGATKTEVQVQVNAAADHVKKVGAEKAAIDFNTAPEWKAKGMSLLFDDMKGLVLAASMNEKLRGKQTLEMKDPSGKEYVKEFVSTAKAGGGWVDYEFINPETKALDMRTMYVKAVSGFDGFVGVAISKK